MLLTTLKQSLKLSLASDPWSIIRSWQAGQALLFFVLISSLMLYPLFIHFFDKVPGGGDAAEYLWKLWWFRHSILESGQSPWLAPDIYYPEGFSLAFGEITAANTIPTIPLTWLLGEVAVYNLLIVISTILSGFGMFLLVREVTGSFGAGLLAGIIFAYAPFRYVQFVHLNIVSTQWLPFIFYCLERFARSRRPIYGFLAGLFFGFSALSSWYYAVAGVIFVSLWAAVRLRPPADYLRDRQSWRALGLFLATVVLLLLPVAGPALTLAGETGVTIPLANSNYYSASATDYFIPSPFHFLWGNWVRNNLLAQVEPGEFIMGWGIITWLFALYSLRWARRAIVRPWLVMVIVAVLLSFGLTLHLFGRQVVIPAPEPVVQSVNETLNSISQHYSLRREPFTIGREDGLVIPLPALLLRWFVPIVGKLRTWTRFNVVALMGISVLAGLGAAAWHRREISPKYSPGKQRVAWFILIGLALFELWWRAPTMNAPPAARPVDHWLAGQPEQSAIVEFPLSSAFHPKQLLYSRVHQQPMVHGYSTFLSFKFSQDHPEMLTFPNRTALRQLTDWGVRYVLVETAAPYSTEAESLLADINQESCLQMRTVQGTVYVFELFGCD